MKTLISGSHGLVGTAFIASLKADGHESLSACGHSGNLTVVWSARPRFTQVFGSGGSRAFQLGARISF